ncbi:hypothetical protein Gohar_014045 [Gossypium harknessii]|uniref:Uncharacterized protein n=1 Tax=Gossypium harknessii TaxID=34285 RepID=A0A7J9H204_9ROSI|nr:hypothetical protein [Gossypium harknessii]
MVLPPIESRSPYSDSKLWSANNPTWSCQGLGNGFHCGSW